MSDEIESKVIEISRWIGNTPVDTTERRDCRQAAIELQNLYDIAIARGRTRTDAVNKAVEWAKECEALQEENERLKHERDEARKELAELRKAPGMEEVSRITSEHLCSTEEFRVMPFLKMRDIASRAIASREVEKKRADAWQEKYEDENSERLIVEKERDEVVGLLKWCRDRFYTEFEEWSEDEESPEHEESNAILEIVEGK